MIIYATNKEGITMNIADKNAFWTANGHGFWAIRLNRDTKQAQSFLGRYNHACKSLDYKYTSVNYFYKNPSHSKVAIEMNIQDFMKFNEGWGYFVTGGNSCTYSAGWLVRDTNGVVHLIYETKDRRYSIEY